MGMLNPMRNKNGQVRVEEGKTPVTTGRARGSLRVKHLRGELKGKSDYYKIK